MTCIYLLRDPVSNAVRYIGKTKDQGARLKAHISKAQRLQTNHHCARWISKLLTHGLSPILEVIRRVHPGEDWQKVEIECIAEYRAAGHPLTNMTAGGDGFHDVHPDILKKRGQSLSTYLAKPENKAKLVARAKEIGCRPEVRAARSAGLSAAWADPEKRRKWLAAQNTPEAKQRHSDATQEARQRPGARERFKLACSVAWSTPEGRAKASARTLKMLANPEQNGRRIATLRATMQRPEVKAKLAAAMAKVNARPEVKMKRSIKSKANWKNPEYREKIHNADSLAKRAVSLSNYWKQHPELMSARMNAPARVSKISAAMTRRNADPAFQAVAHSPDARRRQAATLKATWARRNAESQQ